MQLFRLPEILNLDAEGCESWFWTLLEMVVPGLPTLIINKSDHHEADARPLSAEVWQYLVLGGTDGQRSEAYRAVHGSAIQLPDELPAIAALPVELFPGFLYSDEVNSRTDWQCCVSIVGIVIFSIGKAPNEKNITAFSAKRREAAERKLGKKQEGIPVDEDVPYLSALKYVNSYFALKTDLREYLVTYFIERLAFAADEETEIINTHLRLWFGTGLTHVSLIRDLMTGYGDVLEKMPAVASEMATFESEYAKLDNSAVQHRPYLKVMKGDKFQILNSRKFPELFRIARSVAELKDEKYKNFAPNIGVAKSWDQFCDMARDMGLYLPGDAYVKKTPQVTTTSADQAQ